MHPASKLAHILSTLLLTLAATSACADVVVTPTLGRSKIDLKPAYAIDGEGTRVDGTITGVSVGYQFDSNILIGGNLSFTYGDNLFSATDDYRLYEGRAFIGYVIPLHDHFRITPLAGISRWEMDTKDEFTGSDSFVELMLEFPITDLVVVHTSYTQSNFIFGRTKSFRGGVTFQF